MSNAPIKMADDDDAPAEIDFTNAKRVTRARKGKDHPGLSSVRVVLGKTQEEVARALGVDQGEVSRLERRDDVRLSTLQKYAHALGCTLDVGVVLPNGQRVRVAIGEPEAAE